jgi:hypothetical protein
MSVPLRLLRFGWMVLVVGVLAPVRAEEPRVQSLEGKVVPLTGFLKKHDVQLDPDAAPYWLALETGDGKIYPVVKDAGGRTFYHDQRLWDRPVRIQGRIVPGTSLLQVLRVHSLKAGKPHEVYYWCEVCSIKRYSQEKSRVCECCGGQMELREVPADK